MSKIPSKQDGASSFHGTIRKNFYSDIDEGDLDRLRLIIETRAKIKEVQKSTRNNDSAAEVKTKRYMNYIETQSSGSALNNVWLEFLHQISIPSEIFDLSEREVNKVLALNW